MKPSKNKRGNNNTRRKKKNNPKPPSPSPPQFEALTEVSTSTKPQSPEKDQALTLDWLTEAFSSLSSDQITSAFVEAGGDAYNAAGILGAELDDPGESAMKRSRKQKKVATCVAATGTVSSVIGKGYVAAGRKRSCGGSVEGKGMKNRSYSVEEAEEFLCSMLGYESELGMDVVKDVLGQCGYDVGKALDALLYISDPSCKNYKFTDKDTDSAYPASGKEDESLCHLGINHREQSKICPDLEEQPSTTRTVNPDLQQEVLKSLFNIPDYAKHKPNCMDWKKVVKQVESFGQGLEYAFAKNAEPLVNARNGKQDDYQICRSVARKHWDTMRSYYQRAAVAYSRGERAHAAHLSEAGKFHSKLAREADEKASREIFEARNKDIKNTVTIDLHGQHVKQAIGFLKLHLLLFRYIPSIQFLKVITGSGGVDGPGRGKLKHSVVGLVEKEGIEWCKENSGTLLLRLDGLKEYSFLEEDDDSE